MTSPALTSTLPPSSAPTPTGSSDPNARPNARPDPGPGIGLALEASEERRRVAVVDIVIPVYNEEAGLAASVERLHDYLSASFPFPWLITIADNASTDRTWGVACRLANSLDGVQALYLPQKGRGRALRAAWTASPARVAAYMDVDLSTDLDALLPLVAPLVTGHSDVAIGTRLASSSRVVRGPKREAISRTYNLLLRTTLRSGVSDAQCGFKAIRTDVARTLLPMVEDQGWFFDTELLVVAEHNGMRIHEVPVDWVDDPDSRVDVVSTAAGDLRGIWRMAGRFARGEATLDQSGAAAVAPAARRPAATGISDQLVRFASIGVVSTIVFAVLFAVLIGPLGPIGADVVALAVCSVANTAANRRLTFSLRGRSSSGRHARAAAALCLAPLALTVATLGALGLVGVTGTLPLLAALTLVNAVATGGRFVLLRSWVFA